MKNYVWLNIVLGFALVLTASCGRNEILDTQENQRSDMDPELQGTWRSRCEGGEVVTLAFAGGRLSVTQDKYHDPECRDPRRSVTQTGNYRLAHTFKEGILNSVVFFADPTFQVALHTDHEMDAQNNVLAQIQNEKEQVIDPAATPAQKREVTRENLRIREAKALELWKRNQPKTLNRLQLEKVNAYGLNEKPAVDFETRAAFRYELDNGFLQLTAPAVGNRVYTKD